MKTYVFRLLAGFFIIVLIIGAVFLVRHRKAQLVDLPQPEIRPVPVIIKSGNWGRLPVIRHHLGTITPEAEAVISAQTTGYLTALYKDVGDRVKQGEAVAAVDMRLSEARKNALAEELAGAREDLATKEAIRNRRRQLIQNRAVSREALEESELAVNLAQSRVRRLEQELAAARVSLSFSRLESFFDGMITERMKETGDLVVTGTPIFRVEDPSRGYNILVQVPQETAAAILPEARASLLHGDNVLETMVTRVRPAIVSGNLATLEISSPDRPFGLPSYAVIGVDLTVAEPEGWVLDADTLLETGLETLVFAVLENSTVTPVPVTVLGRSGRRMVVSGPLKEGVSLASGPESLLLSLGPGMRVLPIEGMTP